MGYYTCFTLEIKTSDNLATHADDMAILAKLRETNEMAEYALDVAGCTHNDAKWYDHEEQLKEFSKNYPDALFVLYGDGEGSDDFWYSYFKNGKVQNAPVRLEHDEFNESKLV